MARSDVETAVQNAVEAATGLDDAHVIFADQNIGEPARPYILLRFGEGVPVQTLESHEHDGAAAVGQEIRMQASELLDLLLEVQSFTDDTHGNAQAVVVLEAVRRKLKLPTARDALRAAGLVPYAIGPVRNLAELDDTEFKGRALLEVRCYLVQTSEERTGYIATVELEDLTGNETMDLP